MTDREFLFVYGTLRPPLQPSHQVFCFNFPKVLPYLRRHTSARLPNADLFDLGSFPAAIPGAGMLTGALLEINPLAFQILDPLEGHPDLYRRERTIVETKTGDQVAWIYWAPLDLALSGVRIPSGDWLERG